MDPSKDFDDAPYEEIPNRCVVMAGDSNRIAYGRIYYRRVMVTGPRDVVSDVLKGVEVHRGTRMGAYMHASGERKITFEGLKEAYVKPLPNDASGVNICESIYTFDNIILDAHYTKIPTVVSARVEYPFDWGMMIDTYEPTCLKRIHIPDSGIIIEVLQESERSQILQYKSKGRFLTYKIKADHGIDMNEMMKYIWQLNNFLTLFMGWPIYPQRIAMKDAYNEPFLYYPGSMFYLKKKINTTLFSRRMEYDEQIDERFECLLRRWFLLYRKVGRPISEYFESGRGNSLYRARFIDHTNTIQRIYRKTDKDTRHLCVPLSDAMKIYDGIYSPDPTLITSINETRNHFVHGDSKKLGRFVATSDFDLAKFGNIVAMLIEGKLLNMIAGDDPKLLDTILKKIHRDYVKYMADVPGFIEYGGPEPGESDSLPSYELTCNPRSQKPTRGNSLYPSGRS